MKILTIRVLIDEEQVPDGKLSAFDLYDLFYGIDDGPVNGTILSTELSEAADE